jgi:hypothetical protein
VRQVAERELGQVDVLVGNVELATAAAAAAAAELPRGRPRLVGGRVGLVGRQGQRWRDRVREVVRLEVVAEEAAALDVEQ